MKISQETVTTHSTDSTATSTTSSLLEQHWYENDHAKNTLISSASAFYALILTIAALIYELSHLMKMTSEHEPQLFVGSYMYGMGILFLSFCYYELFNRHKHKSIRDRFQVILRLKSISVDTAKRSTDEESNEEEYIIAGTTCLIALYQMRVLIYIDIQGNEQEEEEESQ
uniref:Uncharacterized protein n=1 Tax=Acrobeloides nanus TaxID=290746 RepID=A0A914DUC9_9BILA